MIREKLSRRLVRLEEIHAAAMRAKATRSSDGDRNVAEMIREHLRTRGFAQTGNESLAETVARAFTMNSQELRHLMAGPVEDFNAKLRSL